MKNIIKILILVFLISANTYAQDIVRFTSGDSIVCQITNITSDTLYMKVGDRKNIVETYINIGKVKDYQFHLIEKVKNESDTFDTFFLKLEDGTELTGKVLSYDKNTINFDDNNFGEIKIKAYKIKSLIKENTTAFYLIKLTDGNQFYGKIIERRNSEVFFETKTLGKVTVPVNNIKKIQNIGEGKIVKGSYWFSNPNNTRYLFSPSAFNLKEGDAYYQNIYVLANNANYGLTDHFSIGGGFLAYPIAAYIMPKINFKITEKLYTGIGVLGGAIKSNYNSNIFGIGYGVTTYGTIEHNISIGAGYGFFEDELMNRPIILFSGMTRLSKKIALVTENWSIPVQRNLRDDNGWYTIENYEYETYFSIGMRIMSENITIDLALVNSKEILDFIPIGVPYVDFVYKF